VNTNVLKGTAVSATKRHIEGVEGASYWHWLYYKCVSHLPRKGAESARSLHDVRGDELKITSTSEKREREGAGTPSKPVHATQAKAGNFLK
jgi:hypothetical protein